MVFLDERIRLPEKGSLIFCIFINHFFFVDRYSK